MKTYMSKVICMIIVFTTMLTIGMADIIVVNAAQVKPQAITLTRKEVKISLGRTYKITIKSVSPQNASTSSSYKSSNSKIATVSKNGTVTPKKIGTTYVTVKSQLNNVSSKIKIMVVGKSSIEVENYMKVTSITNGQIMIPICEVSKLSYNLKDDDYLVNLKCMGNILPDDDKYTDPKSLFYGKDPNCTFSLKIKCYDKEGELISTQKNYGITKGKFFDTSLSIKLPSNTTKIKVFIESGSIM